MTKFGNFTVCTSAIFAVYFSTTAVFASDLLSPAQTIAELQKGGHILYMRHASTESDYADQIDADVNNCSTQRTLSEKGWNEAETIGSAVSLLGIPVGALYSSEYCRAWQTARIAFGKPIKVAALNFAPVETMDEAQTEAVKTAVMPLLSAITADKTNTVIVAHDDPFEAATGIYPEPQGVVYAIKPDGESFKVIGAIMPDDWTALMAVQ